MNDSKPRWSDQQMAELLVGCDDAAFEVASALEQAREQGRGEVVRVTSEARPVAVVKGGDRKQRKGKAVGM